MEWRIKLEARSGWGEVETIEVAHFKRCLVGLTTEEIGLSLDEAKQVALLSFGGLARPVVPGALARHKGRNLSSRYRAGDPWLVLTHPVPLL